MREIIAQRQEYRNKIGNLGEQYVLAQERAKLAGTEYADSVRDYSDDPSTHFDILSYTKYGDPIYIEVKTTNSSRPDTAFYMSQEEIDAAWEFFVTDQIYEIHRVYNIGGEIDRLIFSAAWLFKEYDFEPNTFAVRPKRTR